MIKQVDLAKIYAQKRALIVNPAPKERTGLKSILQQLGAIDIDMCANAFEAVELCEKHHYHLVVSEYDLGADKNGQQLIEELRYYRLLSHTAVYILLTDNTSAEQVLHTLEYQPDTFLSKPTTEEQIRQRINSSLIRKHTLSNIYLALDAQNNQDAIQQCKQSLTAHEEYQLDILKQLGELYLITNQPQEALTTYTHALKTKSPVWASVGKVKTLIAQKKEDQAQLLAEQLVDKHPLCVNGFELLAMLLEQKHDYLQAQQMWMQAVKLTPSAYGRQKKLAILSDEIGDHHNAYHAYKAAIKCAKNSHHETFEDSLSFSAICMQMSQTADPQRAKTLIQTAKNSINYATKRHPSQPLIPLRAHLLNAQHQHFKKNTDAAKQALNDAKTLLATLHRNTLINANLHFCIECAQAFISLGEYTCGERLLLALTKVHTDNQSAITIDKYLREPLTKAGLHFAAKLNQQGLKLYDQEQWHQASNYFKKVIQELPNHIGLNLNLAQALIAKGKVKALSVAEWQTVENCIQKITGMPLNANHKKRLDYILKQKDKLQAA